MLVRLDGDFYNEPNYRPGGEGQEPASSEGTGSVGKYSALSFMEAMNGASMLQGLLSSDSNTLSVLSSSSTYASKLPILFTRTIAALQEQATELGHAVPDARRTFRQA